MQAPSTRRGRQGAAICALVAGTCALGAPQTFAVAPAQSAAPAQRSVTLHQKAERREQSGLQMPSAAGILGVSAATVAVAGARKRSAKVALKASAAAGDAGLKSLLLGEDGKGGAKAAPAKSSPAKGGAVSYKKSFLFPGQGAQTVGMCKDIVNEVPAAAELFKKASAILGYDLLDLCVNGPKEKLDTTAVSQPAIFTASMAALEKLKQEKGDAALDATVAMGLSLGEYSALCYAGAISFEDGVKITKARGEAMQAAADAVESSMVSVIGLDAEKTAALCEKASKDSGKTVQIANFLCKGNYTVSGDKEACAKLVEIAKPEFKARMAVPLAVAGAFHTDFMAPAVKKLEAVLKEVDVKEPRIPVVSNVDGKPHGDAASIRATLCKQVTAPVLWETQMEQMVAGDFGEAYELGPGKVCAGILKRVDKKAAANISNVEV